MSTPTPSVVCTDLSFAWPDGDTVFDGLDLTVSPGRNGLVGVNGSGKSTLLRLIVGELVAARGTVSVTGRLGHVHQNVTVDPAATVADAIGVARTVAAVRAIEAGDVGEANFAAVGDDWDIEERTRAVLDGLGLDDVGLTRAMGELSGGEAVLLTVAAELIRQPDVLVMDEPTNNLDRDARQRLYDAIDDFSGTLLVVSHDRELLAHADRIADLRQGHVAWYGGNIDDYEQQLAAEQDAAERQVRAAEAEVRRQERERNAAQTVLSHRKRYGQKMYDTKREPRAVMRMRKRTAQVSAAKLIATHDDRLDRARERLAESEAAVHDDRVIRIDLPATVVPPARRVLTVVGVHPVPGTVADLTVHGPERIGLTGRNGAGKTMLLETITGRRTADPGTVEVAVPLRYLPQNLAVLDDSLSVVRNVARVAPDATDNEIRARLARFLFRGRRAEQLVGSLSGGERFRAALAALLLAQPAPQLLILDEPTNNLDMTSVRELLGALESYRGALLVVSHDVPFLRELGLTRWLGLDDTLHDIDPL